MKDQVSDLEINTMNILTRIWNIWENAVGSVLTGFVSLFHRREREEKRRRWVLIGSTLFLLITAPLAYLAYTYQPAVEAGWFDDNFLYRKKITFTNSGSAITSARRVLIEIDTATLITDGKMQSDCDDTRFTDVNGRVLNFYIHTNDGDCNTASTDYYVEVPTLTDDTNVIYQYYGNPSAGTGQTWDPLYTNIEAFWKMEESSGTRDSETGTNDLAETNSVTSTTGKIGNAASFDGTNDYLSIDSGFDGEASGWRSWAGWVYFNSLGSAEYILSTSTSGGSTLKQQLWKTTGDVPNVKMGSHSKSSTEALSTDTWYHIVGVWALDPPSATDPDVIVYVNGVNRGQRGVPTTASTIDRLDIGANNGGSTPLDGRIDAAGYWEKQLSQDEIDRLYNDGNGLELDPPEMFTPASGPTLASEERTEGPSTYWKFDEGYGTTTQDATESNNDGTITNASWVQRGRCLSGKCLRYDGNGDYVTRADDADFDFAAADSFTLQGWIRHGPQSSGQDVIAAKYESTGGDGGYKILMEADGDITFGIDDDNSSFPEDSVTSTAASYDNNRWYHITAVKNGTTSISLYIDGKHIGTDSSIAATGTLANDDAIYIGIDGDGSSNDWKGFIDEFKVYPYVRSAGQIKQDFAARGGASGAAAVLGATNDDRLSDGLAGYWKMDESSANTCTGGTNDTCESSGNGNDGTWNNGATNTIGKFGNGVTFDGNTDYIEVSDPGTDSELDFSNGDSITLTSWVNMTNIDSTEQQYIVGKGRTALDSTNQNYGLRLQTATTTTGEVSYIYRNSADDQWHRWNTTATITENTGWHHVAVTYTFGDGNSIRAYINGVEEKGSWNLGNGNDAPLEDNDELWLGDALGSDTAGSLQGSLDETRIYNRALSPAEIGQLYNWAPGPVGYWPLDENTGTSSTQDISSNGLTGTMNGTMTESDWVAGQYGSALDFDGSNDYISASDNALLEPDGDLTVTGWVKLDALPSTRGEVAMLAYKAHSSSPWYAYSMYVNNSNDKVQFQWRNTSETPYTASYTGTALTTDQWYHLAAVKNGTTLTIYVNGSDGDTSTATTTGTIFSSDGEFRFGASWSGGDRLDGQMDDVRVYNYARTPKQIIADMNASHPAGGSPIASQTVYYTFDEQQGSTTNNQNTTQSSITGSVSGATWKTEADCKINGCLDFDGTDDVVTVTNTSVIDLNDNLASGFTFSSWVYVDSDGEGDVGRIFHKGGSTFLRTENESGGAVDLVGRVDLATANATLTLSGALNLSTWYHIAMGWTDDSDDELTIWINGVNKGSSTDGNGSTSAESNDLLIAGSTGANFDGKIDEFKIYSSELTQDEILIDMNANSALNFGSSANSEASLLEGGAGNPPTVYWAMNEGADNTCTGGTDDVCDLSGNENNGAITNATWSSICPYGNCTSYDGDGDYITRADDADFEFAGADTFTLQAWFRHTTQSSGQDVILAKYERDAGYKILMESDGDITFGIDDDDTSFPEDSVTSTAATYDDNQWHHVTAVKNGTTSISLYIDGQLIGTDSSLSATGTLTGDDDFFFGIDGDGSSNDWLGSLDEFKIYDYVRSQAQITYDYNRGAPIAHYRFDECQGSTLYSVPSNPTAKSTVSTLDGSITIGGSGGNDAAGSCDSGDSTEAWANGATGKFGSSLDFDGTDDYAEADPTDWSGNFSLGIWVKGDTFTEWESAFSNNTNVANSFQVDVGGGSGCSGEYRFYYKNSSNGHESVCLGTTSTEWAHLAVTFDGTTVKTYRDGQFMNSSTPSFVPAFTLYKIANNRNSDRKFDGKIDDIRIYNYPLSANQMKHIYNNSRSVRFGE